MRKLPFSVPAGYIVVGNGVATSTSQLYVNPYGLALANLSVGAPLAIGDTSYGSPTFTDILKHFSRCRFTDVSVVIEPYGQGASNSSGVTICVAPVAGGLAFTNFYASSGAASALNPATVRGSKGAVEFPAYRTVRIPLTEFLGGMDGRGTYGIPSIGPATSVASSAQALANAITIPCGIAVAGVNSTLAASTLVSLITFEGYVDLLDCQNAITWGSPIGLPSPAGDVKEPAPRSVLADRGQIPRPPDDREWVTEAFDRFRQDRLVREVTATPTFGASAAAGDVKPAAAPNGKPGAAR
jgi:hypothetical protein